MLHKLEDATLYLQQKGCEGIKTGVVLGTGLGSLIQLVKVTHTIPYRDIPHFPVATVEFHKGQLVVGMIGETKVIIMQGRFHYYEGYSMQEITFPVRVMHRLGINRLFLSNAAGAMNPGFKKADLVMVTDHINLLPENPLRGLNDPAYGNRFVDMSQPYAVSLQEEILNAANSLGLTVKKGVYVAVPGPNLETRAEYRHLHQIGADMVGMSTVPEVIVANHVGLPCAAISVITDECDPDNLQPVNIEEIIAVAGRADELLARLFYKIIESAGQDFLLA